MNVTEFHHLRDDWFRLQSSSFFFILDIYIYIYIYIYIFFFFIFGYESHKKIEIGHRFLRIWFSWKKNALLKKDNRTLRDLQYESSELKYRNYWKAKNESDAYFPRVKFSMMENTAISGRVIFFSSWINIAFLFSISGKILVVYSHVWSRNLERKNQRNNGKIFKTDDLILHMKNLQNILHSRT